MREKLYKLPSRETCNLFSQLIRKELVVSLEDLKKKWVQACISILTMFIIFHYIMPKMGLHDEYVVFFVISLVASFGFYDMVGGIAALIADLNGDRSISYLLTIPLSNFLSISSIVIGWSLCGILMTLLLLPCAQLLLFSQLKLTQISFIKFLIILISANLLFGYFALWLASLIQKVKNTGWLWIMVINPLYMLGCYYCSWKVIWTFSKTLAIIQLFNPITYVMEGIHSTILGQQGFLSFWICLMALWVFIPLFSFDAYRRLKRRLDFI